jgi:hypothetical protein
MKSVRKRDGRLPQSGQWPITHVFWNSAKALGGKDHERVRKITSLGICCISVEHEGAKVYFIVYCDIRRIYYVRLWTYNFMDSQRFPIQEM